MSSPRHWRISERRDALQEAPHPTGCTIEVLAQADDDTSGWCARLLGVDPASGFARHFMAEEAIFAEALGLCWRRYHLTREGGYQIDVPLYDAGESLFFWWDGEAVSWQEEGAMRELLRRGRPSSWAQVEAACLHEQWEEAERAALNLPNVARREEALSLVRERREEASRGRLPTLTGSARQQQWAMLVRARALVRLGPLQERAEIALMDAPDSAAARRRVEEVRRAMRRLREERAASYWIAHRDELEDDEARFLATLIGGGEPLWIVDEEEEET